MDHSQGTLTPQSYEPIHLSDIDQELSNLTSDNVAAEKADYKHHRILSGAGWLMEIATLIASLVLLTAIAGIFK